MRCGFPDSTRLPGDPDGTANNPHHRHATTHTYCTHTNSLNPNCTHTRRNAYSNYQAHTAAESHSSPPMALEHGLCFSGRCLSMRLCLNLLMLQKNFLTFLVIYLLTNEQEYGMEFFFLLLLRVLKGLQEGCAFIKKKSDCNVVHVYLHMWNMGCNHMD